ncbi:suppressor protein SRP40 isoform X1 [Ooceraea biroi]|uniref:suppressor protein SRP40 isoform X1 n=1 Tax=Ooceraea biroi TaxID=2015173 RepID=UPI000F0950C7|nr:suppressor protein SRP40 isoform X1 [Ooceraea biroi]
MAMQTQTSDEVTSNESYITSKLRLVRLIVVQSSLGQRLFGLVDSFLWTVEKCAEWSLHSQEIVADDGRLVKPAYVRPLPWFLFLPSLMFLRGIRMTANLSARIMGYPEITPTKMVRIVQNSRKRVLAIKMSGRKNRQDSKDKRLSMHEARKALIRSIRLTLSTLSCLDASKPSLSPPPTRIHVNSAFGVDASLSSSSSSCTPQDQVRTSRSESTESDATLKDTVLSGTDSENSPEKAKESLNEMIAQLAQENSVDDKDYVPDDTYKDESSTEEDSTEEGTEEDISMVELSDIVEEANELLDHKSTGDESDTDRRIKQDLKKEVKQTPKGEVKQISTEVTEQSSKKATEKAVEQNSKKATEEAVEQSSKKATEQNSEKATEQNSEKATEQSSTKATKQNSEKATKQNSEKATEQSSKKATEQNSEKATEQNSEKATEQNSEKATEQSSEKATEQNSEKATEQTSEETAEQNSKEDLAQSPEQRILSSEESRAKVDDRLTRSRSHDSLECYTPDRSSQEGDLTFYSPISSDSDTPKEHSAPSAPTADKIVKTNQFLNGEIHYVSEAMISESKSLEGTNNGAVVEKRSTNVSKIHRGKRTSHGNRKKK